MGLKTDGLEGDYFMALVPLHEDDFYDLQAISDSLSTPEDPKGDLAAIAFVQVAIRRAVQELRDGVRAKPDDHFAARLRAASLALNPDVEKRFFGSDEPAPAVGPRSE
ncbi:MAG TPA: hypothetical protein VLF40_00905 [Candidatus Saccharimonadales bacterium]|nr:hypothetical protein [Candidatus Saccharimonadales bacterium]